MRKTLKIVSAATLILAFGLFNVGLPVVLYLCPLMQSSPSQCPMMSDGPSDGIALVNQNADCCGKYIVAERNTTPFVKAQQVHLEQTVAIVPHSVEIVNTSFVANRVVPVETFHLNSPPVFLLNSAFLI